MSGHSKWSTIKRKKGAADAKRGAVFTKLANEISIAAREGGGDPASNFSLRLVMDRARGANMPNANVDRAIKRGTGDLIGEKAPESVTYEGYGPGGVAILVDTLTDNRNRTASDVRSTFIKRNGSLGEAGSVGYLFDTKGIITVTHADIDEDSLMMAAIDAGATEVSPESDVVEIETDRNSFAKVKQGVEAAGFTVASAELAKVPKSEIPVTDKSQAESIVKLIDDLENLTDTVSVSTNADIEPELVSG
ncbi:YebC/PmpR family DNA-binding transcriptional regulator [Patescibacteria group bacterium]|nr:YebC/PmpR family DNA-binding transcriptional regulator [Patescibacteria group bacterium]